MKQIVMEIANSFKENCRKTCRKLLHKLSNNYFHRVHRHGHQKHKSNSKDCTGAATKSAKVRHPRGLLFFSLHPSSRTSPECLHDQSSDLRQGPGFTSRPWKSWSLMVTEADAFPTRCMIAKVTPQRRSAQVLHTRRKNTQHENICFLLFLFQYNLQIILKSWP